MKASPRMRKKFLKAKEARLLMREVYSRFGIKMNSRRVEEWTVGENIMLFLVEGQPRLLRIGETLLPTLSYQEALERLSNVVVDMGAVPYVCGGADVMAPGITEVQGEFEKDALVVIKDERYGKALALGLALFSSEEMRGMKRGRVVENLHYVGDKIWDAYK